MEPRIYTQEEMEAMFSQSSSQDTSQQSNLHRQGSSNINSGRNPSFVWNYFTKTLLPQEYENGDPSKLLPSRWNCACNLCHAKGKIQNYALLPNGGTGSMSKHLKREHGIYKDKNSGELVTSGSNQTLLGGYMSRQPGGGIPFTYNRDRMIDNMARYVNLSELPFSHGESDDLEEFNRLSLQPAYTKVPRNTLKRRTLKQYYLARGQLIEFFNNFEGRVGLTCDCWTSKQGDPFVCITVHWIDSSWILQKRIITFDVMDESHNGFNIYTRINQTLIEFNLRNKLFTISFDNASANTKCIDHVIKNVPLLLDGQLLHVRCCAHIINLSCQEGIVVLHPLLAPIRKVVRWIRNTQSIRRDYKKLCRTKGLPCRKFALDTPTRWNSTHTLLSQALIYKDVITELYNNYNAMHNIFNEDLDESSWNIAENVCNLLETYKYATDVFSLVYEPNVHLVIIECMKIVSAMCECEIKEPCLELITVDMRNKWLSYFKDFPYIYGIATLLDPCIKAEGLKNILDYYYVQCLKIEYDVDKYVHECKTILINLYDIYKQEDEQFMSSSSIQVPKSRKLNNKLASIVFKRSSSSSNVSSSTSIVNEYLTLVHDTSQEDFEILSWWQTHSGAYPTLAKIARDILAIPSSTVASESAFSAGRRVLDEKRSRLCPESIKMCVCKKDWDQAEKRIQGMKDDDSDEDDPMLMMDTSSEDSSIAEENE